MDGGGVTAIGDCVSIFVRVKPLNSFRAAPGQCPTIFVATKTRYFKPKRDLFLSTNQAFFVPKSNQLISTALSQHKIQICT